MSQPKTSSPLKSIQNDQESPPTSKTDSTDHGTPKAEKPKQRDVVPNKPKNSQPNANAETAATKGSASKLSITEKLERLDEFSTSHSFPTNSQPNANAETAVTKGSGSKLSYTEKLERLDGMSDPPWIERTTQTTRPCGPCECWSLDCDGEHPMCNNCEYYGRRCSYD